MLFFPAKPILTAAAVIPAIVLLVRIVVVWELYYYLKLLV